MNKPSKEYKLEDYLVNDRELKQEFDKEMKKQAITNYDKIRNMTLDEMAEWLAYYFTQYGYEKTKQWLESESEG